MQNDRLFMNHQKGFHMKNLKFSISAFAVVFLFVFAGFTKNLEAQAPVYAELTTWKYNDLSRDLIVKATTENEDGDQIPAVGLTFNFFVSDDGEPVELGSAKSDEDGKAILKIEPGFDFPKDDDNYVNITAVFDGNDNYEATETELQFKDVIIDLDFVEEDGTKYISYSGKIITKDGLIPLADDDVFFYVPRMFSYLKIADGWFEENGEGVAEYPENIIGDSAGRLEVHARILDHWDYGNVDRIQTVDWARKSHLIAAERPTRELWTPIAPLWMIITLIIMLAGVWGHYIYAMYELYMIKKISKRENKKDKQ